MIHSTIATLRERVRALADSYGPVTDALVALRDVWRSVDAEAVTEADEASILNRWACRTLWQWLGEIESGVHPELGAELVATGTWRVEDAVWSAWAASCPRRAGWDANAQLEAHLISLVDHLEDRALPALRRAVEDLGPPELGRLALALVERLVATGEIAEASAARSLAQRGPYAVLCLAPLASHLDEAELLRAVEEAWQATAAAMRRGDAHRAYRAPDWALLVAMCPPALRRAHLVELDALVESLPAELREGCSDYDDLNATVGRAWAAIGERDRALDWAARVSPEDREAAREDILCELASRTGPTPRTAIHRPAVDGPAAVTTGADEAPLELRAAAARRALRDARRRGARTELIAVLVYELAAGPSTLGISDGVRCVEGLLGASRASLAATLFGATRWGRAAILCRTEWGWRYTVQQLLLGASLGISEAEVVSACAIADASALVAWLSSHPPNEARLRDVLSPDLLAALLPALHRSTARDASWATQLEGSTSSLECPAVEVGSPEADRPMGGVTAEEPGASWQDLDPVARRTAWCRAFSEAELASALPFSWRSTELLTATASLMGGMAYEAAAWVGALRAEQDVPVR